MEIRNSTKIDEKSQKADVKPYIYDADFHTLSIINRLLKFKLIGEVIIYQY